MVLFIRPSQSKLSNQLERTGGEWGRGERKREREGVNIA